MSRARAGTAWPALLLVVSLGLGGCPSSGSPNVVPLDGDATMYANDVQPVVARHCAYLGCHGREGMPLTLYAVDFLRLRDPQGLIDFTRPPLDERALSEAELDHNRQALAERAGPEDPGGSLLVRRLLPLSAGGIPHAGVIVFAREDDPDLQILRRFLDTAHAR